MARLLPTKVHGEHGTVNGDVQEEKQRRGSSLRLTEEAIRDRGYTAGGRVFLFAGEQTMAKEIRVITIGKESHIWTATRTRNGYRQSSGVAKVLTFIKPDPKNLEPLAAMLPR